MGAGATVAGLTSRVLRSSEEIAEACAWAEAAGLPPATDERKSWDNRLALEAIKERGASAVVDLGCRSGIILTWLYALGFRDLSGCDIRAPLPPIKSALAQRKLSTAALGARMYWSSRKRLRVAPAERTGFEPGRFDAVTAMSVIEHSVDTRAFFAEAHRLLRPGGLLFLSTDYWPGGAGNGRDVVFSREDVARLATEARAAGLGSLGEPDMDVGDAVVFEGALGYTFLTLAFEKPHAPLRRT